MHLEILALLIGSERKPGCRLGIIAEDRQLLEHQPDFAIFLDELDHLRHRLAAIAAIVVEELHKVHITIGIARHM